MVKISIIPPVYNVEKYLPKFIKSIIEQTFTDWELILVDDGSTDNSGEICEYFSKVDSRIKVIHKKNGGAPSARNRGIKESEGKYLYFPDPDDWLENDYLQKVYSDAEKYKCQLLISGFVMEYYENGKNFSFSEKPKEQAFLTKNDLRENIHNYFDNMMVAVPWNKLYSSKYIKENGIEFPNIKWDDLHFNMEILKNIDSVVISSCDGYHFFRSRPGSETTKVFDGSLYIRRKEQFQHILQVYHYWNINNDDIWKVLYGYYAGRMVQCIQEISASGISNKKELITNILNDSLTETAFANGNIKSKILNIASFPMKNKNVNLSILYGKIIGSIKEKMPTLFYYLKSRSVNNAKRERTS